MLKRWFFRKELLEPDSVMGAGATRPPITSPREADRGQGLIGLYEFVGFRVRALGQTPSVQSVPALGLLRHAPLNRVAIARLRQPIAGKKK